jgi:hypothetical protein
MWGKRWNFYSEINSLTKRRIRYSLPLQNIIRFVLLISTYVKLAISKPFRIITPVSSKIFLILYRINIECLGTHLRVIIHALGWPSPVHHFLWFDTALCGNCYTLHWLIDHLLRCDTQLFTAAWTQRVHNQKDEVASWDLLNAEWSGEENMHSSEIMDNSQETWGCHSGDCPLGCNAVQYGRLLMTFQKSCWLHYSETWSWVSKKETVKGRGKARDLMKPTGVQMMVK